MATSESPTNAWRGARSDTHCHLGWPEIEEDLERVLARAAAAGLVRLVDVAVDLASARAALARARSRAGLHPTAGLHPNDCAGFEEVWPELAALARAPEVCAIGETGLDFYRDRTAPDEQRRALEAHLALAVETGKPLVLHCRDAFEALFEALAPRAPIRGVLHCFTGGPDEARTALDLGLHVSFAGPLTYPKNEALRGAAALVPEDRLLVETDAPFLPPQGRRGRRNEPCYVQETLAVLAEVRGRDRVELGAICHRNAARLFGFPEEAPPGGLGARS